MRKNRIRLSESQLRRIVKESVRRMLNEAEDGGWVVETDEAEKAYEYFAYELGNEEANKAIVRTMGDRELSEILAYLFRMYDLRGWYEYRDEN